MKIYYTKEEWFRPNPFPSAVIKKRVTAVYLLGIAIYRKIC
jgi:hypothetical protein